MSLKDSLRIDSRTPLPDVIHGYVSVRSQPGTSVLDLDTLPMTTDGFHAKPADRAEAAKVLESMGLTIIAESPLGFALAGEPGAYEELTGGRVVTTERLMRAELGRKRYVTHIDVIDGDQPGSCGLGKIKSKAARLDALLIERPRIMMGVFPPPIPPNVSRDYLRVPDDVALGLSCAQAHRAGQTGRGAVVAMVDSGQYDHPFFRAHGYRVEPPVTVVPGTSPDVDPVGHGTGESANTFAVAPDCTLRVYRATNAAGKLVGAIAGFLRAKRDKPDILANSWGGDDPYPPVGPPDQYHFIWGLEILDAIERGIFVVFAAGNGHFSLEPQIPGVLSAGGVYMESDLDFRASTYASGYASPWFDGMVPDVCGLVGLPPRAQYIMLPVPPGCMLDRYQSASLGGDWGDGTSIRDGWALFSGTSAAAPQVAGVAALVLGARPDLTPKQVSEALTKTAIDVRYGRSHPRFNRPARYASDEATGFGLVNASSAVERALAL